MQEPFYVREELSQNNYRDEAYDALHAGVVLLDRRIHDYRNARAHRDGKNAPTTASGRLRASAQAEAAELRLRRATRSLQGLMQRCATVMLKERGKERPVAPPDGWFRRESEGRLDAMTVGVAELIREGRRLQQLAEEELPKGRREYTAVEQMATAVLSLLTEAAQSQA